MRGHRFIYRLFLLGIGITCLLQGCINNDIGYPQIALSITAMQVEGQVGNAIISEEKRMVTLGLDESVDMRKVLVRSLSVTEGAKSSLSVNDVLDLTSPCNVTLSLYQEYQWSIIANREISRSYKILNQIGVSELNEKTYIATAYVSRDTKWKDLQIVNLKLGPDGATYNGNTDFSSIEWIPYTNYASAKVKVKYKDFFEEDWELRVYRKDKMAETKQADGFVNVAWLYGEGIEGLDNGFEIREVSVTEWEKVPEKYVTINGAAFTAYVPHLKAQTTYVCRAYSGENYGGERSFTTGQAVELPDGSFENWHSVIEKKHVWWKPWTEGTTGYWDTGNKGVVTASDSNTTPTTQVTWNNNGTAACLQSKNLFIKFAAGNLFMGEFLEVVDGTNGLLDFGKPFSERPTKLKGHYKYVPQNVTILPTNSDDKKAFEFLKNKPDTCSIYIALGDWDSPVRICTTPSKRQLFDKNDEHIIAYAELNSGKAMTEYEPFELKLDYRVTNRVPKYIVVVCSASKYGDYFAGGDGSTLWVDDFSLEYDYDN